ncbi:Uncharacterized protein APZ42_023108 [Daphnia magna]|uniref:Uncharacterized protein n=1 Tax=Daphnia magna TaxID=35525 RepID=A0A164V6E0_9CRUS|nr:Uncharacterized protein APZ42_023108 [Daphnia magna]
MSQSDVGDTYAAGSATQGKKPASSARPRSPERKALSSVAKRAIMICRRLTEIFSNPNVRPQSKHPLSADNSIEETLSELKKLRYEDLTSITEDKELSHLDSLSKNAIRAKILILSDSNMNALPS